MQKHEQTAEVHQPLLLPLTKFKIPILGKEYMALRERSK